MLQYQASLQRKYSYIRYSPQNKTHQRRYTDESTQCDIACIVIYIVCVRGSSAYVGFLSKRTHSNIYGDKRHKVHLKEKFCSKSKNRVWIATDSSDNESLSTARGFGLSQVSPHCCVLAGREIKTRQGNKQWMSNRQLQLAQQSLRKAALLSTVRKASLVSLQRGNYMYMLDSAGKRLKKVDPTAVVTTPVTYHVNVEASVKRIRAKYGYCKQINFAFTSDSLQSFGGEK